MARLGERLVAEEEDTVVRPDQIDHPCEVAPSGVGTALIRTLLSKQEPVRFHRRAGYCGELGHMMKLELYNITTRSQRLATPSGSRRTCCNFMSYDVFMYTSHSVVHDVSLRYPV